VASPAKSRLGNAVLQRNDRPSTVDDDRTLAAKVVQGMGIEDVKRRSGDPVIEFRRRPLAFSRSRPPITISPSQDFHSSDATILPAAP